jgi:DnaA family protein
VISIKINSASENCQAMMKQLPLEISEPPVPTLKNFIVGKNAELIHLLNQIADGTTSEKFIYLWGEHGSGKTHLLKAIASQHANAVFTTCRDQPKPFTDTLNHSAALTVVDDVGQLTQDAQIDLFNLYNRIREQNNILIVAGNALPKHLNNMREDLVTRLSWGLAFQVHNLSDEEKAAALSLHAKQRGFNLPAEAINYLLSHINRDMPSLIAMIDALDRYSLAVKRPVTIPLIKEIFLQ